VGRAVPRPAPRYDGRDDWSHNRFDNNRFDSRRDGRWSSRPPVVILAPRATRVYRPYYSFRPRVSIGFGLFVGFPVSYPTWYDPFRYDNYYAYRGYRSSYGGLSFDIRPLDTEIFVDGEYVGTADQFGPYDAPLTVFSGLHRVELYARGCQPVSFDLTVLGGQVIPYRGSLGCAR
jgi:hypothetical protein